MKRVLILASLFYPQKNGGGPTVSIMNLVKSIKNDFDVYVITKNYEVGETKPLPNVIPGWNEFDFGKVYYFNYEDYTMKNVYKLICDINADVIYQNSFFSYETALPAALYKKTHKCKLIIAPRGEFSKNAFSMKKSKKNFYFKLFKLFGFFEKVFIHTTGNEETKVVQKLLKNSNCYYYNIPNISLVDNNDFHVLQKQPGTIKIIYVARIHKVKNLLFAIQRLKSIKGNVQYDIYGPIEDIDYWEQCKKEIQTLPTNIEVNYRGQIEQGIVTETIKNYHLFYMPTLSENYGHSIVEALSVYRPVIISNQTPWLNLSENGCGYDIDLNDSLGFESAIQTYVDMPEIEYNESCLKSKMYISEKQDKNKILKQYNQMFNE